MSLREEINKELAKSAIKIIKDKQIDVHLSDKIISIFEKRIDEIYEMEDMGILDRYNAIKEMLK